MACRLGVERVGTSEPRLVVRVGWACDHHRSRGLGGEWSETHYVRGLGGPSTCCSSLSPKEEWLMDERDRVPG